MKATALVVLASALALAGCGKDDTIKPMSIAPQDGPATAAVAQQGPVQPAQARHSESGSWFLPAAIGYLLGSMGSARSQPQVVQAPTPAAPYVAPAAQAPQKRSWFARLRDRESKPAVPSTGPTKSLVPASKPPVLAAPTAPKFSAPTTPKFSGPSGYKAPSYSFKPSTSPSRSFSSGRR